MAPRLPPLVSLGSFFLELTSAFSVMLSISSVMPVPTPRSLPTIDARRGGGEVAMEFERECVQFFAEVVQILGVPKSVGQIYGALYASPVPLSFSDIVSHLEISKGSASQGLQLLRTLGAINVVAPADLGPLSGSGIMITGQRDYYVPELSLRKLVSGILRERVGPLTKTSADRLTRLRRLAEGASTRNGFYSDRARQLNTWRRRCATVIPVLNALLGPKR